MTQQQYIIKRKLNIVELSEQLGNISEACRRLGVSRRHYYDIKAALEEEGVAGLLEKARNKPRIGNRVAPEIEERVLSYSLENPMHGQTRTSNELKKEGIIVGPGGVRSIWLRHGLERRNLRLKRLESWAADFLNDKVLPFFDSHNLPLLRVLTDRGTEYCGARENHSYQLFLYLNDIEHSKTKARHPQTNGCTERFNQTLLDEFYQVAFRKKVYTSLEEIQADLDQFLHKYNTQRTNQGKHCKGRTPMETFTEGLELCRTYLHDRKEVDLEAA